MLAELHSLGAGGRGGGNACSSPAPHLATCMQGPASESEQSSPGPSPAARARAMQLVEMRVCVQQLQRAALVLAEEVGEHAVCLCAFGCVCMCTCVPLVVLGRGGWKRGGTGGCAGHRLVEVQAHKSTSGALFIEWVHCEGGGGESVGADCL